MLTKAIARDQAKSAYAHVGGLKGYLCKVVTVFFFVVHAKVSIHIASQWRVPIKKLATEKSAQMKRRNENAIFLPLIGFHPA